MDGSIFGGLVVISKFKCATGGVDLVMKVAPFFHAQK